tara:strand:+ start:2675 stop:3247 length:573 start_codon:yes stop_codon:yes gene_type:complete
VKNANEEFQELMMLVRANYRVDLTDQDIYLFKHMAKQHGFNSFKKAMTLHMQDADKGVFMPKIADIVAKIAGTKKENQQELEGQAQMQWQNIMRAIQECGSYRTPTFKDPITTACVSSMGGWPQLCSQTTDSLIWKGKEFVNMYQNYTSRPIEQLPDHIQGREDIQQLKGKSAVIMNQLNQKFNDQFGAT